MAIIPRVSILIPNFNNGRESSANGDRNFIEELFVSLVETLETDPTPIELIVMDDGSQDDSLATCRAWSGRTWRGGQPFLRLIEAPHCGVLSIVANRLTTEARGEFCVRLDGDIVCLTKHWVQELCRVFDTSPPTVGMIGPKQLGIEGRIHAAGDWILHPRGMHHIAQGADRHAITRSIEVDHVMGCFYCHRRRVWEEIGGYDERILRGQTIDFGMAARLKGWRAFFVPSIEFTHNHGLRVVRNTRADTTEGVRYSLDRFHEKWGFDRIAPDLDDVARMYAGTPLLWNARVFGPHAPWPMPVSEPLDVEHTEWGRYADDLPFRQYVDARAGVVAQITRLLGPRERILHVVSRAGLLAHILAKGGERVIGIDPDPRYVQLANQIARSGEYPAARPSFVAQPSPCAIPQKDESADTVLLFDVIERHHNPVGLFREARRVLKPGGVMAIVTPERTTPYEGDGDQLHAYRPHELGLQLQAVGGFRTVGVADRASSPGLIVMVMQRESVSPAPVTNRPEMAPALVGV